MLLSAPTPKVIGRILQLIFPKEIKDKFLSYMPSDGANCPQRFVDEWKNYAQKHNAKFQYINNSLDSSEEIKKLLNSNILIITGGNTFQLLYNLRMSGLDKAIQKFVKKNEFVLSGFSAGALALTPTIDICNLPNYDKNEVGLKDMTGIGVVNFEVFPHYSKEYEKSYKTYKEIAKNEVKTVSNDDYILLDI